MAEALWHGSDVIAALDTHLLATLPPIGRRKVWLLIRAN